MTRPVIDVAGARPAAPRVLVAGIGNVFHGDDGFGVEVASRLATLPLPESTAVRDFGVRGIHLAFEMTGGGYDVVVLVDACPVAGPPGTLAVIEADRLPLASGSTDGHDLDPASVLRLASQMSGTLPRVLVVGCQPADVSDGIGLTGAVQRAIDPAIALITKLIAEECRPGR